MTDSDLKYLLTLPPEEIVKWFYSKGYTFSWNWNEVWQDAHMRSFTVAKVMNLDILQSLKDEVDKIFSAGCNDFISKPIEKDLFDMKINRLKQKKIDKIKNKL